MADLVRITNHRPTMLHLPDALRFDNSEEGPRVHGLGSGKSLVPGGNNVEKKYWSSVREKVKPWLDLHWISEGGDVSQPEGIPAPQSLTSMSQPEALTRIGECSDVAALKRWLSDVRQPVAEAVKRRLGELGDSAVASARADKGKKAE